MNISLKSASRSLTVVASLLCLGGVLSFAKSKQPLAMNIILVSASVAISSELVSKNNHNKANNQLADIVAKYEKEWKTLNIKYDEQSTLLKQAQILKDDLHQATESINLKNQTIEILQGKVKQLVVDFEIKTQELEDKLQCEDMRYQELIDVFKGLIFEHLNERIYKFFNSLDESINKKLENEDYQAIHENLIPFKDKLQLHYDTHCELLKSIEDIDGDLSDIVTDTLNIYSRIVDEQTALKIRFRNLLNLDERRSLEDAYNTLADITKTHTPITKAKDLLGEYSNFQKNQLNNLGEQLEGNVNSLEEMRGQVFDLIAQIEKLSLEKLTLQQQLDEAKKPQQFYGSGKIVEAGNRISNHYYKLGYKLDCLDWLETSTGYTLTFGIRSNPALTEKELFADNLQEQLAAYTTALKGTLPTAEFNRQNCTLVLTVQLRPSIRKEVDELSDESINRLARSWDTWKKHAKKWNRIRITGGSGAGKSPLTERIVSEQLQHKKVKGLEAIKLYNPQAGSRKDNWSFPSVGKTHQDSIRGIAELTALCGRKYQGSFGIWIFDEVDSTLRQAPGKKRATAEDPEPEPTMSANMLSIITQIDHTSQAVFYLGQGANTGKIPSTTKGDWNNLVAIHINGNAKDYLRLADHIDTESKDKLMKQADLLQRYCDRKYKTKPARLKITLRLLSLSSCKRNDIAKILQGTKTFTCEGTVFEVEIANTDYLFPEGYGAALEALRHIPEDVKGFDILDLGGGTITFSTYKVGKLPKAIEQTPGSGNGMKAVIDRLSIALSREDRGGLQFKKENIESALRNSKPIGDGRHSVLYRHGVSTHEIGDTVVYSLSEWVMAYPIVESLLNNVSQSLLNGRYVFATGGGFAISAIAEWIEKYVCSGIDSPKFFILDNPQSINLTGLKRINT